MSWCGECAEKDRRIAELETDNRQLQIALHCAVEDGKGFAFGMQRAEAALGEARRDTERQTWFLQQHRSLESIMYSKCPAAAHWTMDDWRRAVDAARQEPVVEQSLTTAEPEKKANAR